MGDALVPAMREALGDLAECFSEHVAPIKFVGDVAKITLSFSDRLLFHKIRLFLAGVPPEMREFADDRRRCRGPG